MNLHSYPVEWMMPIIITACSVNTKASQNKWPYSIFLTYFCLKLQHSSVIYSWILFQISTWSYTFTFWYININKKQQSKVILKVNLSYCLYWPLTFFWSNVHYNVLWCYSFSSKLNCLPVFTTVLNVNYIAVYRTATPPTKVEMFLPIIYIYYYTQYNKLIVMSSTMRLCTVNCIKIQMHFLHMLFLALLGHYRRCCLMFAGSIIRSVF